MVRISWVLTGNSWGIMQAKTQPSESEVCIYDLVSIQHARYQLSALDSRLKAKISGVLA
ncbi:MAG: hypothetical protein WA882_00085 [Geitlerinemataceae cyanobacterium]